MRVIVRIAAVAIALVMLFPAFAITVSADGMSSVRNQNTWGILPEHSQYSLISYRDGIEQMVIGIEFNRNYLDQSSSLFWIFPIPADPANANIGLLTSLTTLTGKPTLKIVNDSLRNDFAFIYGTQIYSIPFSIAMSLPPTGNPYFGGGPMGAHGGAGSGQGSNQDIIVYQHIEGEGLVTELISATSITDLNSYLQSKSLVLSEDANALIADYIARPNYCFVASWVEDGSELLNAHPASGSSAYFTIGVSVTFPTDKIFFPLKLTKAYGSSQIPIAIDILGYVSPPDLSNSSSNLRMSTVYKVQDMLQFDPSMAYFFSGGFGASSAAGGTIRDVEYTEIVISGPAYSLWEDLFIDGSTPASMAAVDLVEDYHWFIVPILFISASCLASLLSGLLTYRSCSPSKRKFALLGLFNLLTLIGLIIAVIRLKIDSEFARPASDDQRDSRKGLFIINFVWMFIAIVAIIHAVLYAAFIP